MRSIVSILVFVLTFALVSVDDATLTESQIAYAVQQEQCVIEQDTYSLPLCDIASGQSVSSTSARRVIQNNKSGKALFASLSRIHSVVESNSVIFKDIKADYIATLSLVFKLCNIRI